MIILRELYNTFETFLKSEYLYSCINIQAFAGTCAPGLLVGAPDAPVCSFSNCFPRYSLENKRIKIVNFYM